MKNKPLKANIKRIKEFIVLWVKFHDLYKDATKKGVITPEEENLFLETKSLITDKYEALKHSLKLNNSRDETMDVMSHVLSLKSMTAISDKALDKIEKSWKHSYLFLNKAVKSLENQNQELVRKKNHFEFLKKIFSKKITQFIILVLAVFIMFYIINVVIRLLVR